MGGFDFDAIVVGSGFGGSVMAYRLAQAKQRVCVLERGKPYPAGSFARSPVEMRQNFWDPSEGLHGLFNVWSFRGIDALVASGLGGGSLIYANVLIRKPEKWFVKEDLAKGGYEYWPLSREELDPHYQEVERMLGAQTFPFAHEPYASVGKTLALQEAARKLKLDWYLPNLAVTFGNPGAAPAPGVPITEGSPNLHGSSRSTCKLCGECNIGCNYGSKNTLDYNYLSQAKREGADIRTRCEVRSFEPNSEGGYTVTYVEHHPEREGRSIKTSDLPLKRLTTKRLILAAGSLGSTFLLLKNRKSFPRISPLLGTRFSGNGDLLAFVLRSRSAQESGGGFRPIDITHGPVISSTIRVPDALDGGAGRGYYIQEAGIPVLVAWALNGVTSIGRVGLGLRFLKRYLLGLLGLNHDTDLGSELSKLFGASAFTGSSLPLLALGRDIPDGKLSLRGRFIDLDWKLKRSNDYLKQVEQTTRSIAAALDGEFAVNPTLLYLRRLFTVHPLGGCPMGRSDKEGVVDAQSGEVFNYPGLHVVDGAMMPGPVGPNPALTIAALSDRFASHILEAPVSHGASEVVH
ncbi:MAG TPA: GMC family oxidoreductase [Polyangiaceae bacterium]|nr:GMC family oxidoreductase [Polyangiaceae bacterium]